MKRLISIFLLPAMLLSLTACSSNTIVETTISTVVPETDFSFVPEETVILVTEPTLSPEEIHYSSLPDRIRQAVDVGIVELNQLEDLDRIVTVGEASKMLQKAYVHRTGVESLILRDLMDNADYSTRNATRGWIINIPGLTDIELRHVDQYQSYEQWLKAANNWITDDLGWSFPDRLEIKQPVFYAQDRESGSDALYMMNDAPTPIIEYAKDFEELCVLMETDLLYGPAEKDRGFRDVAAYGFKVYDSTTGKKFISLEDYCVCPTAELTIEDAAEHALIFYHFPNPMAYPSFMAPEEMESFNPEIITPDLLTRETSLPEVSNEKLPSTWHGVVLDDMEMDDTCFLQKNRFHTDDRIYEYEILKVKEAGFNYIGLNLDFNWLMESLLYAPDKHAYVDFTDEKDCRCISEERMEQVDQVIAWCMENDIHVNIRATGIGGFYDAEIQRLKCGYTENFQTDFTAVWQAIARRYQQISNEYLSFTPITASESSELDNVKQELVTESILAIQEIHHDRCIIADIFSENMKAETFAQMGVALSFRMREPSKILDHTDYYRFDRHKGRATITNQGKSIVENFAWPYDANVDAAKLLTMDYGNMQTFEEVLTVAKDYGVGFILSDFGIDYQTGNNGMVLPRIRYPDEPYFAMITDITSTMEELGCGWCFAHWYSPYGIAFCMPAIKTSTYEQFEDYPYYIDQGMFGLFQEINGVK